MPECMSAKKDTACRVPVNNYLHNNFSFIINQILPLLQWIYYHCSPAQEPY